jgi:hypothetical protein
MEIPNEIYSIIEKINQSEDKWKALYMATWRLSYQIKSQFENTTTWDKKIPFGLPSSKNKFHLYTPHKIYLILTSRDEEFTLGHLQTLFSLFEDLINESSKTLCTKKLRGLLGAKIDDFFKLNKDLILDDELKELILAKETRNCYIHNKSKINKEWLDSYKNAKGNPIASVNDNLNKGFSNLFHQIEDYNNLIVKITNNIKNKIEST